MRKSPFLVLSTNDICCSSETCRSRLSASFRARASIRADMCSGTSPFSIASEENAAQSVILSTNGPRSADSLSISN